MDKDVLDLALASNNWWMGIAGIALFFGILGEYISIFAFDEQIRQNKIKMAVSVFFGVLVLSGIVGEYVFGKKLSQTTEQIQQGAHIDVARAEKEAQQAQNDSAFSLQRAEFAEQDASENKQEATRLRKAEEAEHVALLHLEVSTAPRRLSAAQRAKLEADLRAYRRQRAEVIYRANDLEAFQFSADLAQALAEAKWIPTHPEPTAVLISVGSADLAIKQRRGLFVQSTPDTSSRVAAKALVQELRTAGFEAHTLVSPGSELGRTPTVYLSVEARPASGTP